MKHQELPTNSELEILTILWEHGNATVREIHDVLSVNKSTGYTTTLKIVQNMYDKQLLSRKPKGKAHIYIPEIKQEFIQKQLLGGFVNRVFKGSSKSLILNILGDQDTSQDDLLEIRKMLDKLDNSTSEKP